MSTWQIVERWVSEATIPSAVYGSAVISFLGGRKGAVGRGMRNLLFAPLVLPTPCPSPWLCDPHKLLHQRAYLTYIQHLHPDSFSQMGDIGRRLEEGDSSQVFLPLAPTLPVCAYTLTSLAEAELSS